MGRDDDWRSPRVDKRKVITAYRRGFITMQECAQILGLDSLQLMGAMSEQEAGEPPLLLKKQPASG